MAALHKALWVRDWRAVERLLKDKADVNAVDDDNECGYTPLHIAAITGCEYSVRLLIEYSANHFTKDSDGATPRILASFHNNKAAENLLIELFNAEPEENWGM